MMSLLYATNMSNPSTVASTGAVGTATAAAVGGLASRSRLDDEINQTSFKVRKYIESKLSVYDPILQSGSPSQSTDASSSSSTVVNGHDRKAEMGKLILDARMRLAYAQRLQQSKQQKDQTGGDGQQDEDRCDGSSSPSSSSSSVDEMATEARFLGDIVTKMRETTTAEYCALKDRAAALEKQKQALDAEYNLCVQSLQVVGQAGSSVIDCDEWYTTTIAPALHGSVAAVIPSSPPGALSSFGHNSLLQSRNDEDVSTRSSYSSIGGVSTNPFIETILRKEEEKRTLRCAEVMASLATKQNSKYNTSTGNHHIEGQWTESEDAMIVKAVTESNAKPFTSWTALSEFLPGRTGKQIRERWFNSLDPNINKSPFTPEDDDLLWESHHHYGKKWVEIAAKAFNGYRSANQVKNRWHSAKFKEIVLMKHGEGAYQRANAKPTVRSNSKSSCESGVVSEKVKQSSSTSLSLLSRKREMVSDDLLSSPELKKVRH